MTDNETIADIIAWLRLPRDGENGYLAAWRDEIADRLEAALKRERGDCAKLRDALKNLYDQICHGETEQHVAANRQMIRAALAAPQRNCDRFDGDYKMLHTAWFDWTGTPSGQNPDGTAKLTFAKWLLAPATEKKGGNDGSK